MPVPTVLNLFKDETFLHTQASSPLFNTPQIISNSSLSNTIGKSSVNIGNQSRNTNNNLNSTSSFINSNSVHQNTINNSLPIVSNSSLDNNDNIFVMGNSLTWDARPSFLDGNVQFGIRGNTSITSFFDNPLGEYFQISNSSSWLTAFENDQFDWVSIQPHDKSINFLPKNLGAIAFWMEMQPDANFLIHTGWNPSKRHPQNYHQPNLTNETIASQAYLNDLYNLLHIVNPDVNIHSTKAVEILESISQDIDNGVAPFNSLSDLYRDAIHMTHKLNGVEDGNGRYLMHNVFRHVLAQPIGNLPKLVSDSDTQNYLDSKILNHDYSINFDESSLSVINQIHYLDDLNPAPINSSDQNFDVVIATVNHTLDNLTDSLILKDSENLYGIGNNLNNLMVGNGADNLFKSKGGDDIILGKGGHDSLYGGNGNDAVHGGDGNDRLLGKSGNDLLVGSNGTDFVKGGKGNDVVSGGNDNDQVVGNSGDDTLIGGQGKDSLNGDNGNDQLIGGTEEDILIGDDGDDTLTGGDGNDIFRYDDSNQGVDTIIDYTVGEDSFLIRRSGFADDLAVGELNPDQFKIGTSAMTIYDRFIYDNTTGYLFFDADGIGVAPQQQIASLSPSLDISFNDFNITR